MRCRVQCFVALHEHGEFPEMFLDAGKVPYFPVSLLIVAQPADELAT